MASAIIHTCVAKVANEILNRNEKEFFLGSIAPDISKQIGETKKKSHFLPDNNTDIPEIDKFLEKYKLTLKDNAFNLGYYCHLFTDMIWYGMFAKEYYDLNELKITYINGEKKELKKENITKLLYNDYTNLNIALIDEYNLDLSLYYEEYPTIKSEIEEIPIDKLNIIIEKMGLIIEESKERKTIVFDEKSICRFVDKTAKDFIINLEELGVIEWI